MYHDSDVHSLIGQSSLRLRMTKNLIFIKIVSLFLIIIAPLHDPRVDQEPKPKAARGSGCGG